MSIENTAKRDGFVHLLGAMSDGSGGYIEGMERDGQRQLVNSTDLPTKGYDVKEFEAVGFTFGPPHTSDPMFRPATLPEGWKREGSDHAMWSYILDQHGRRRVSIFYKAAWYDRDANMSLNTPVGYLRQMVWDKAEPVLDDVWLTRGVAGEALTSMYDRAIADAEEADGFAARKDARTDPIYWRDRAAEHRAEAKRIDAMRKKVLAS